MDVKSLFCIFCGSPCSFGSAVDVKNEKVLILIYALS